MQLSLRVLLLVVPTIFQVFAFAKTNSFNRNNSHTPVRPMSRALQSSSEEVVSLPFFIKLHKVASSTTASLFNCIAVEHPEYYRGMLATYSKCQIKHSAWSHMNMNELELYGMPFFAECMLGDPTRNVRIVTILRNPADRFVSAFRYFDKIRKRTNQVRRVMDPHKSTTVEELRNLTYDIFSPLPSVHPEVRLHEYVDVFEAVGNTNKFVFDPRTKGHLKANGHEADLESVRSERYSPLISPSRQAIDKAKEMLSKHFLVGITENMMGFMALLSVEFDWPTDILCLPWPCQLKAGNGAFDCATAGAHLSTMAPHLVEEINRLVEADLEVYLFAKELFQQQASRHGALYEERKAELLGEKHQLFCADKLPQLQKNCKQM